MSAATVLTMLAAQIDSGPLVFPITRREEVPEPEVMRVWSCWITPSGMPAQHLPVEAFTKQEAHGLARKAAFALYPGKPFTTVVRS